MKNEFNVNLCEYCIRCRFGKLDKNGKRIFYCKYAEPHSYKVEVCSHYFFNIYFKVPRTSIFTKLGRGLKTVFLFPYYLFKKNKSRKVEGRACDDNKDNDIS